jgi:hypothetical protein
LVFVLAGCGGGGAPPVVAFLVHDPAAGFDAPKIVLHHDAAAGTGFDWETVRARATTSNYKVFYRDEEMLAWSAAAYLEEGIRKMTGRSLAIESGPDIDRGIVLLTLPGAPPALRDDPEIAAALAGNGVDAYAQVEAYYIRTEADRVLLIANGAAGLVNGVVHLLESADYEVLGMGPDWIHVPDRSAGLSFALRAAGRPSWYLRELTATSGQYYGVGTIYSATYTPLVDPADEYVDQSYWRWRVGTRTWGMSMPPFPGHALQAHHEAVLAEMVARGSTDGFLAPAQLGLAADRPDAASVAAGTLWIATDAEGTPNHGDVYRSDGATWTAYAPAYLPASLDLSVAFVREVVLDNLESRSETWFADHPDELYVYGTDPEDGGGYAVFADYAADPTWYPDYRTGIGDPLGAPYALHGMYGIDQPVEEYDPSSVADCVYGFNDWLLREYDAWLAARPAAEQVTSSGRAKRDLVRTSFYSYNYHDVPPGFQPDPRMRIMVAGYAKHRGRGEWKDLVTHADVAAAMRVLLPNEPSATYTIWSLAYYQDFGIGGVVPTRSSQADKVHAPFADLHDAGMRGFACETDFNHGKHGLSYYLMTKVLWDASLDAEEVDALRDRWLRRAFGAGFLPMKEYYDLLTPEAWFANTETLWAKAVDLIEEADALIDPALEPAAQRRLDDVKQTWWWHYLTVTDQADASNPDVATFLWKGQMSYQVAMHVLARRLFGATFLHDALDPSLFDGPAHYTSAETEAWWSVVRDAWEQVPVTLFSDVTLADGTPASDVDLNDLVWTDELVAAGSAIGVPDDRTFWFNSGYQETASLLVTAAAGEPVGFSLSWTEDVARYPSVGIERWDAAAGAWEQLVDPVTTSVTPVPTFIGFPGATGWGGAYSIDAPVAGTYRVEVGRGGNGAQVTGAGYDFATGTYATPRPCTFFKSQDGLTQYAARPIVFVYVPRGVPSLDMELLNDQGGTAEIFTRGVVTGEAFTSREVTLGTRGTQVILLAAGEDGGIVAFTWNGFLFPVLYSVPQLWARSPAALLVPRAVAAADGLTPR